MVTVLPEECPIESRGKTSTGTECKKPRISGPALLPIDNQKLLDKSALARVSIWSGQSPHSCPYGSGRGEQTEFSCATGGAPGAG